VAVLAKKQLAHVAAFLLAVLKLSKPENPIAFKISGLILKNQNYTRVFFRTYYFGNVYFAINGKSSAGTILPFELCPHIMLSL